MKLEFSPFKAADFPDYKSWYRDTALNSRLGPMDDEWLTHILREKDGCQYGVFLQNELVAVVGIKFPDEDHPYYVITDLAIKPSLRSKGIGSLVLHDLMALYPSQPGQSWKAFVDVKNPTAKLFFEKNGWSCESKLPDQHGMLILRLISVS